MLWITLQTTNEIQYLDAANFVIHTNGKYTILLLTGETIVGDVKDIRRIHVEAVDKN